MKPFLSIVVPLYNRERLIERTLRSCISQDYDDFEIIVVDDRSTDNSFSTAQSIQDRRIRIIRHDSNRGVGSARNTGAEAARGEWVISLDSDDELLPGGLRAIFRRATDAGADVDGFRFACRLDDGRISPDPPLVEERWDYEAYLRWMEGGREGLQETTPVVRRHTFETVRYANDRAREEAYHIDFAQHFVTQSCPDVVRLYHSDADNQFTAFDPTQVLPGAKDQARSLEYLILKHGEAMARFAPNVLHEYMAGVITCHFLARDRASAMRATRRYWDRYPISGKVCVVVALGMIDRRLLALAKASRARLVRHQDG